MRERKGSLICLATHQSLTLIRIPAGSSKALIERLFGVFRNNQEQEFRILFE